MCVLCSEKAVFRPSDEAVFTTLGVNTHLFACEPSELESLVRLPLIDCLLLIKVEMKASTKACIGTYVKNPVKF